MCAKPPGTTGTEVWERNKSWFLQIFAQSVSSCLKTQTQLTRDTKRKGPNNDFVLWVLLLLFLSSCEWQESPQCQGLEQQKHKNEVGTEHLGLFLPLYCFLFKSEARSQSTDRWLTLKEILNSHVSKAFAVWLTFTFILSLYYIICQTQKQTEGKFKCRGGKNDTRLSLSPTSF